MRRLLILIMLSAACGGPAVLPGTGGVLIGKFRATHYFIPDEEDSPSGGKRVILRDRQGEKLAVVSESFARKINLQGSGRLRDGRIINVSVRVNGKMRYHFVAPRYGTGARGAELEPFCSVAVDTSVIPMGTYLFIEETRGMRLPSGEIHDGIWIAEDRGGKIKGDRIDLFVGEKAFAGTLREHGIRSMQALTVRRSPSSGACLKN